MFRGFLIVLLTLSTVSTDNNPACLTWSLRNSSIIFMFRVDTFLFPISFHDPFGQVKATCISRNDQILCNSSGQFGNIEFTGDTVIFTVTKFSKQLTDGFWSCKYGEKTVDVIVSISEGILHATDLQLTTKAVNESIISIKCSTCWNILASTVEFLANHKSVDNLRYVNGRCFHNRGECTPETCYCSDQIYEWNIYLQAYLETTEFSCKARFRDSSKNNEFVKYTTIVFNGTESFSNGTITKIIKRTDEEIRTKKENDSDIGADVKWIGISASLVFSSFLLVWLIKVLKRKVCAKKNKWHKKEKNETEMSNLGNKENKPPNENERALLLESKTDNDKHKTSEPDLHKAQVHQDWLQLYSSQTVRFNWHDLDEFRSGVLVFSGGCQVCKKRQICALCKKCEHVFCDVCSQQHSKQFPDHCVGLLSSNYTSKSRVICESCSDENIATEVCTECMKLFCDLCSHKHNLPSKSIMRSKSFIPDVITSSTNNGMSEISFTYKISLQNKSEAHTQVRGLVFLSDGRILLAEQIGENNKLQIFYHIQLQIQHDLMEKTNGLTAMSDNKVAITFATNSNIIIFKIDNENVCTVDKITLLSFGLKNLKPFAISYNDGCFAVEVGSHSVEDDKSICQEGEIGDGKIVVLNEKSNNCIKISNKEKFADFTGNSIRLALDMARKRVFVAAMTKGIVSCVNFEGKVLLTFEVPSPRSIVFSPTSSIILASRTCNKIYRLNLEVPFGEILLDDENIQSPTYIAFDDNKMLLCIHVKGSEGQEVLVYQYNTGITTKKQYEMV